MTLDELLAVIVDDETEAVRLVHRSPGIAQARATVERLIDAIPHQLYAGDTALHVAAAALRPLVVSALIDTGADPHAANRRGAIALHYACDARQRSGGVWNPSAQRLVIERLLDAGSTIEHADQGGATPLHRAVRARSPEAVRCLLERGARVDVPLGGQRGTPLDLAARPTGASGTKGTDAEQQQIIELLRRYAH